MLPSQFQPVMAESSLVNKALFTPLGFLSMLYVRQKTPKEVYERNDQFDIFRGSDKAGIGWTQHLNRR